VPRRRHASPKQGASSGFKFGRGCGAIEATIQLLEIPMAIAEPSQWKKFHGLRGSDKEASRQRALMLFPSAHVLLARKADHGKAEASLIALAGVNRMSGSVSATTESAQLEAPYRTGRAL
jgi:hypothetical protein